MKKSEIQDLELSSGTKVTTKLVPKKMMKVNRKSKNVKKQSPSLKQNSYFPYALSGLNSRQKLTQLNLLLLRSVKVTAANKKYVVCPSKKNEQTF